MTPADIDWGYLVYGQDGYASGPGAHWITDPVAMAIPVSIVRGVMHMDNGTVDWKDSNIYYKGANGASTAAAVSARSRFRETRTGVLHAFIDEHPLGALVTHDIPGRIEALRLRRE